MIIFRCIRDPYIITEVRIIRIYQQKCGSRKTLLGSINGASPITIYIFKVNRLRACIIRERNLVCPINNCIFHSIISQIFCGSWINIKRDIIICCLVTALVILLNHHVIWRFKFHFVGIPVPGL